MMHSAVSLASRPALAIPILFKPKESKKSFKERSSKFINLLFDLEQKDRALAGI